MASSDATTTFGASIVPRTQQQPHHPALSPLLDSPAVTPAASREELALDAQDHNLQPNPPRVPFYKQAAVHHQSLELTNSRTNVLSISEKDLEKNNGSTLSIATETENPFTSKISVGCNQECRMWPSKQTVMQGRLAEQKRKRDRKLCGGCGPVVELWGRRSKKERLAIKIGVALLIVGIIVAIAVGISIAVDGSVYSRSGQQKQIGN